MSNDPRKTVETMVELLTTTGSANLDEVELKKFKKFCK
jgi:hypothetical protein